MARDRWDDLFEDDGLGNIRALMGSEDVEPGLERGDGYYIAHEVRVTEKDHVSLVRLNERPRVRHPLKVTGDPAVALAEARASLKGRKGKSRQLLKVRIARLEALVGMGA
jgi:hypothetical protein